ncbi:hypothetical protein ES703_93918 [subsurface metagenome]
MGYIRRLDSNADIQTFPGANFEATGDIPAPQCSEAQIEGTDASTKVVPEPQLTHIDAFIGWNLAAKICHITASVGGNTGDFTISNNTNHVLYLNQDCGAGDPVAYYITDGGELILTRNVKSLAEYIHAAGYAYTFKAGKLYTNMPNGLLKNACTILWDPLT